MKTIELKLLLSDDHYKYLEKTASILHISLNTLLRNIIWRHCSENTGSSDIEKNRESMRNDIISPEECFSQDDIDSVHVYSRGLVCCSVCSPKEMTIDDLTKIVNIKNPAGENLKWELSKDETFKQGNTNPCECDQDKNRLHYLFNC